MKVLVVSAVALALIVSPVQAWQCPSLISQLNKAVAAMNPNDPRMKEGKALTEQAQGLHDRGNHDGAVAKANDAAKVLGVSLK
jgi:hypothetical protein